MNRQQRRQMRRDEQGAALDADDPDAPGSLVGVDVPDSVGADLSALEEPIPPRAPEREAQRPEFGHRTGPRQFLHEVNVEMRKVAWPSRAETINYSTVVLVTLAILMALIFGLDFLFTHLASFLFNP